ncbi:type II toxin-antitoxin system YoeB family toxin [Flavobacterium sp. GCM10023249]|uniref:type II toxin-antitoxin system YoeB family toxin n=1 Tax=unclassified Flavobacterium TaxID=196869 RepID=UPI00360AA8FE
MEIYFNEMSVLPQSTSVAESKHKIFTLIETMKALKEYDFNILRTHNNFYSEDLGSGYTFSSFLNDPEVTNSFKILLLSIAKNPFIADEDSNEAEMFIVNQFETNNHLGKPTSPEGIAISYICEVPTISITGFPLWDSDAINLKVTNTVTKSSSHEDIINLSCAESVFNHNFVDWIKSITTEDTPLNSYENIIKVFPIDKYEFDPRAINEIISWYYDDKRYIIRIKKLIEDIRNAPFVGGMGLTENLGGGQGSKRIVKKDRIVYTVLDKKIKIHSCKMHYNDK